MNTLFKFFPAASYLAFVMELANAVYGLYDGSTPYDTLEHEMALRERMKKAYLSQLTGTSAKIPLTGSVLVNESKPPLRDPRRYLTGSTVTESRPNAKPNSVIDTEGEPNE
jgi:hypothetical protein